jgi:hypothetical protein
MGCGDLIFTQGECEELVHILANDHVAIHHDNPLYSVNVLVDAPFRSSANGPRIVSAQRLCKSRGGTSVESQMEVREPLT